MPFAFTNTEGMQKQNARPLREKWLSVFFKKPPQLTSANFPSNVS